MVLLPILYLITALVDFSCSKKQLQELWPTTLTIYFLLVFCESAVGTLLEAPGWVLVADGSSCSGIEAEITAPVMDLLVSQRSHGSAGVQKGCSYLTPKSFI